MAPEQLNVVKSLKLHVKVGDMCWTMAKCCRLSPATSKWEQSLLQKATLLLNSSIALIEPHKPIIKFGGLSCAIRTWLAKQD